MRKLYSLLVLMCVSALTAFAAKEDLYLLHEGFEGGVIPTTWTQEFVAGDASWVVEASEGSVNPTGAAQGNYRAILRNNSTVTQGYTTRLISPVFDIKDVVNPILILSHAQLQRTGDVDPLKVYYRTSADAKWVLFHTFTDKTRGWATDTLNLTAQTATYQIAFEVTDNFGWGVTLDEIIVRPMPTCTTPDNIRLTGLSNTSVSLAWSASLDADSFRVVLSTKAFADESLADPSTIVLDTVVSDYSVQIDSLLNRNTRYYAYISSFCGNELSEWGGANFTTKNFISVPYVEDFDTTYTQNSVIQVPYWTHGTSIKRTDGTMEFMPFINRFVAEGNWKFYSITSTTALAFTGARAISTDIEPGDYVYAATPQLDVENVNTLQVEFWGTAYDVVGEDYASSIIVGVMTDPVDYSTFVAVDTVSVTESKMFNRFAVSLADYKGDGKFIAFASDFVDKKNVFYIDDVVISEATKAIAPNKISVSDVFATEFVLHADLQGAPTFNVVVANVENDNEGKLKLNPADLSAENVLLTLENQSAASLPLKVQLPANNDGKFVEVYVQAVDNRGAGDWALPVKVLLPTLFKGEDIVISFEESEQRYQLNEMCNFTSSTQTTSFPYTILMAPMDSSTLVPSYFSISSTTGSGAEGSARSALFGKVVQINDDGSVRYHQSQGDYIALPQVDNMKDIILGFWAKRYNAGIDNAKLQIGVLTDPYDISTFEKVVEYTLSDDWNRYVVTLDNYTGKGKFICIQAAETNNLNTSPGHTSGGGESYYTYNTFVSYLDNVSLVAKGDCVEPVAIEAIPSPVGIELSWDAKGMSKWQVGIFADKKQQDTVVWETVDTAYFEATTLEPHTPYYYQVSTLCMGDTISSALISFETICLAGEAVPYYENFERYTASATTKGTPPFCWTMPIYAYYQGGTGASTTYHPHIDQTSAVGNYHDGKKYLSFGSSSLAQEMYFALPKMDAKLDTLQMSFWIKPSSSYNETLQIGIMTDPQDTATFVKTHDILMKGDAMREIIVNFTEYTGPDGHIALRKTNAKSQYYIDAIAVTALVDCEKVQNVSAGSIKVNGATLSWSKTAATAWDVMVTSKELDATELAAAATAADSTTILVFDRATTNPYAFTSDKLNVNTDYYVYVRGICSETVKGDWSNVSSFRTTCTPASLADAAEDFTDKNVMECWTVGRREGTTAVPSRNTNGYLYMFNSTASEGAYAIMPPLDVEDINKVQISFDAHGGTTATDLREVVVGIISNASDLSTFEPMATLSLPQVSATSAATGYGFNEGWRYTISFAGYEGDYNGDKGTQVMFLSQNGGVRNYVYVDNIVFDSIPATAAPTDVYATEIGHNYANVAWNNAGDKYQVKVATEKLSNPTTDKALVDTIVVEDSVVIPDLDYLTKYFVYVRTINEADTSAWSNVRWFTTVCPPVFDLPYSNDFDSYKSGTKSLPSCWTAYYNGTVSPDANYPSVSTSAKMGSGGNGLYVASAIKYGNSYAALPIMDTDLNKTMLSFFYKSNAATVPQTTSAGPNRYMAIGIAEDVSSLDSLEATLTILDTIVSTDKTNFTYYSLTLDQYTGTGKHLVLIGFGGDDANSTTDNTVAGVYIDDFKLEKAPTCFSPVSVTNTSATASSLTFAWEQPNGDNAQWDVACVPTGAELTETTPFITVETLQVVVTGLENSSEYDVYVRANCGAGDVSAWTDVVTASTLCVVPVAEASWNFDSYETTVENPLSTSASYRQEACWLFLNPAATGYSQIPYNQKNSYSTTTGNVTSKYTLTDSCALRIYSTSAYQPAVAILPEIDADLDTMQIRFVGRSVYESYDSKSGAFTKYYNSYTVNTATTTYAHSIKVGVMTDPYDVSTFEELVDYQFAEVTNDEAKTKVEGDYWEEVTVPLYGVKGKYIAFVSDYDATNYAYIDNVVVEKLTGCPSPVKLTLDEETFNHKHADFSWSSPMNSFNIKLTAGDNDSLVLAQTIDVKTFSIDTLSQLTDYTLSVQAIGNDTISDWTFVSFTTPYTPFSQAEAVWNFEDNLYAFGKGANYLLPHIWQGGAFTTATGAKYTSYQYYDAQAKANTTTYAYARSESDTVTERALQLYSTSTYTSYAILPRMGFELDSMALHFWGRAAYFYIKDHKTAGNRSKLYTSNKNYSRMLVLGTVENEDYATFTPVDTIEYPYKWESTTNVFAYDDETGNNYWVEYTIPLAKYVGEGKQLAIMTPAHSATSYFYLDDMEFVTADFCTAPSAVRTTHLTAYEATLSWAVIGSDSILLQVATDEAFTELLVDSAFAGTTYVLENLEAGTSYYARVKHFCSAEEESEFSLPYLFTTHHDIRFFQNFNEDRTYPTGWERYAKDADKVLDQNVGLGSSVDITGTGWRRSIADNGINSNHMDVTISGGTSSASGTHAWLVTPTISLDGYADDSLMLSFDVALTSGSMNVIDPTGEDDRFIVAVSLDGGQSWNTENAIIWNNDGTGQYVFNDIPATKGGKTYFLDFSKYAGKNITIGFYVESLMKNASNVLHMDNVQLNTYNKIEYASAICRWNDYVDNYFDFDAYDLEVGTTKYVYFEPATKDGEDDMLYSLDLTVTCDTTTVINATICEGETYNNFNFDVAPNQSGEYKQKLQGVNTCDSIVVLNLTVLPRLYNTTEATICQGSYYEFNGEKYYTSTVHTDTLQSVVTGCDSIVTLYLTVTPALTGSEEVHLCPGTSVNFGKFGDITTSGIYVDTLQTALGCDSIVTLMVHQEEAKQTFIRSAICVGETYSDNVFRGLSKPGDYTSEQKTVYGCDSIVTLHLIVASEDKQLTDTVSVEQLPYVLNGVELYDASTEEGVYVSTLDLGCGEVTLTLTVGEPTGLHSTFVNSLAVAPNPVAVGVPVQVLTPFATVEGMILSVYDATGILVQRQYPTSAPIVIDALPTVGVYLVSLQVDGQTYQTKLVVK